MSILVTGGAGFIGAHVVNELVTQKHHVIILDDLSGGFKENVNPQAQFVFGSILDHELIQNLFENNSIEYIFHLAAYAAEGLSHFIKRFNYNNNLIGSINLINAAINHNIKCFVFTSSIAVYGTAQLPMTEETIPQPEDPYGIAKYAVEQELSASKEMFGLNYIIFRPHNVYGEMQNIGDRYRNVVGIFMNQILQDKPLTIFGDGTQTRAFSYIGDVAPIIAKSIYVNEAYNEIFNIGADQPYKVKELAEEVCKAFGVGKNITYLESRKEVTHAYSDHKKAKDLLGYKTTISLQEGIRQMAEWVKQVGARKSKKFDGIEIMKSMPKVWLE